MNRSIYFLGVCVLNVLSIYGADKALSDWLYSQVDPTVQKTPTYIRAKEIAISIGENATEEEAVAYLKPWVYFRGAQATQKGKNCNFDDIFNSIVESVMKNLVQSAIAGKLKGQMGNVVEEKIEEAAQSVRAQTESYGTQLLQGVGQGVRSRASGIAGWLRSWLPSWGKKE